MAESATGPHNAGVHFKGKAGREMKTIGIPKAKSEVATVKRPKGLKKAIKKGLISEKALAKAVRGA